MFNFMASCMKKLGKFYATTWFIFVGPVTMQNQVRD